MHIRRRSSLGLDPPLGGGVLLLLLLVAACGVGPTDGSTSESPGTGSSSGGSPGSSSSGSSGSSGSGGSSGSSSSGGSSGSSSSGSSGSSGSGGSSGSSSSGSSGSSGSGGSSGSSSSGSSGSSGSGGSSSSSGGSGSSGGGGHATVHVNAGGAYSVTFTAPAWTFSGDLGAPASAISTTTGSDRLGSYSETVFTYATRGNRKGRIRAYDHTPVVVFGESSAESVANIRNFPKLTQVPNVPYHLTYGGVFINYSLRNLTADSPWVFFDAAANAFIVSGASHFQNTQTAQVTGGGIVSGIQPNIATLPANFEQTTVLVADTGINRAYETWGRALLAFGGKTPVANDATAVLGKFGYWTDNGAAYHYATAPGMNYQTTLTSMKTYFEQEGGIPLAYMQLDSWWYPKGASKSWSDINGGIYLYEADPKVFPGGLDGFAQTIGVPLIVHARWIDTSSPYRSQYRVSGDVVIDPAYWKAVAKSIHAAGVITYEQDWLSYRGIANTSNLTDQDAYLDEMASAMKGEGLDIQYCMPWPRHILHSTTLPNVTNSRVSDDRFDRSRWRTFLHGSQFVWAVGLWPWSDVYKSSEHDNLLLSLLTAGIFGAGDALRGADFPAIKRALRADGVIIKPDVPILLLDRSIVDEARGAAGAAIATTYTQHAGGRFTYLFAFGDSANTTASFTPHELGYSGEVYVYDVNADSGKAAGANQAVTTTLATSNSTAYYLVAPIGPSGIALLGEKGKLAPVGKKRISAYADDGTAQVTVQFGAGEGPITLQGYAPSAPSVTATTGQVGTVSYGASTGRFTVAVTPSGATAVIRLRLAGEGTP